MFRSISTSWISSPSTILWKTSGMTMSRATIPSPSHWLPRGTTASSSLPLSGICREAMTHASSTTVQMALRVSNYYHHIRHSAPILSDVVQVQFPLLQFRRLTDAGRYLYNQAKSKGSWLAEARLYFLAGSMRGMKKLLFSNCGERLLVDLSQAYQFLFHSALVIFEALF